MSIELTIAMSLMPTPNAQESDARAIRENLKLARGLVLSRAAHALADARQPRGMQLA